MVLLVFACDKYMQLNNMNIRAFLLLTLFSRTYGRFWSSRQYDPLHIARCPPIRPSPHRFVTCSNGNLASSVCRLSCRSGYYVSGQSSYATCVARRSGGAYWSPSFPTCRIPTCGEPATPSYGSKSCSSYNYGGTCTFRCDSGYTLLGSWSRFCDGRSWTGITPRCRDGLAPKFSTCPQSIIVSNNDRVTSAVVWYQTPKASDNSGSTPSVSLILGQKSGTRFSPGTHLIRYQATDRSGNKAYCSFAVTVNVVWCPTIPFQAGRVISCPQGNLKGATCTFSCHVGFTMSDAATTSCNADGRWNAEFPRCNRITCPRLSAPRFGSILSCSSTYGSSCTFICNLGYELVGSSLRQCSLRAGESVGFWTGSQPQCKKDINEDDGMVDLERNTDEDTTYGSGSDIETTDETHAYETDTDLYFEEGY